MTSLSIPISTITFTLARLVLDEYTRSTIFIYSLCVEIILGFLEVCHGCHGCCGCCVCCVCCALDWYSLFSYVHFLL